MRLEGMLGRLGGFKVLMGYGSGLAMVTMVWTQWGFGLIREGARQWGAPCSVQPGTLGAPAGSVQVWDHGVW
ncbi:hypothetical protein V6N13_091053 [Hibiscus sabdariffa]